MATACGSSLREPLKFARRVPGELLDDPGQDALALADLNDDVASLMLRDRASAPRGSISAPDPHRAMQVGGPDDTLGRISQSMRPRFD